MPWFAVLASRIHEPDTQRDPHDHSRTFVSVCLTGSYRECLWYDPADTAVANTARLHRPWRPYLMRRNNAHRIVELHGTVRTLVIAGPWHRSFRFWTKDGLVPHEEYGK
jgi:hypothetical protein